MTKLFMESRQLVINVPNTGTLSLKSKNMSNLYTSIKESCEMSTAVSKRAMKGKSLLTSINDFTAIDI